MATSFQKKARVKIGQIPGTRPSLYNNQLLVSSGIPSLDGVIGGGLGVGTIMMIEEDTYGNYARLMMKYFVAEAIMTQQSLLLASAEDDPQQLIKELPSPVEMDVKQESNVQTSGMARKLTATATSGLSMPSNQKEDAENKMIIAWRYENHPTVESSPTSNISFGHYYDLTKTMEEDRVLKTDISYVCPCSPIDTKYSFPISNMNPHYCRLLQDISDKIDTGNFGTDRDIKKRRILRIGIHSIGSPVWMENGGIKPEKHYDPSLALFLLALKSLLRSAFAVAVVTVPTHLFQEESYIPRLHGMCDTVIGLDSFAGSEKEKNPVFKEYHGLLNLIQLPRVNSLIPTQPETSDLAFKLRRKKFTIEKLHLPPELSDTSSRSQEEDGSLLAKRSSGACGSSSSSKLDF